MYRREHRHQLSLVDFFLPFAGKLSGDNRWIKLAEIIPWDELEDRYTPQFCKGFGAPAKRFRMALGALIIMACHNLTDEELVDQIKENPCLQLFIGLEAFEYSAPFDPSVMVYIHKRLPESVVHDCNERIIHHGLAVICSPVSQDLIIHKPSQPSTPALGRVCNSRPHWQFDLKSFSSKNAC
jgi:hypothetical protein